MRIYGNILLRDEFFTGTIEVKDGEIAGVWKKKEDYDVKGTVIPTFVNMHTHIGDSWYNEEPEGTLEEVVGPGGLKYRILEDEENVKKGMREALSMMESCGVSHFVDFREEGREGVNLLVDAARNSAITPVILGRDGLWPGAAGVSASSVSDTDFEYLKKMAELAHSHGGIFAIHASEGRREDVDKVLSLNPDFIVHFFSASPDDMKKVADANIPVVLTPRANVFWGFLPDIPNMLSSGLRIALGTDNGMLTSPCMFREMNFAYLISRLYGGIEPEEIVKMATIRGRRILGIDDNGVDKPARLLIFRRIFTPYEMVMKAGVEDIKFKML